MGQSFLAVLLALLLATGCATISAERRAALEAAAQPSLDALQAARFDDALRLSKEVMLREPTNARAEAVYALALYRQAMHDLVTDVITFWSSLIASGLMRGDYINRDYLDFAVRRADERLGEVASALAHAAEDPGISLELCLACWEVDWNRNGRIDQRDRRLLQIEVDAEGEKLPEDDPRRKPTFRFDRADVYWLQAMVSFQRAGLAILNGFDLGNASGLIRGGAEALTLKLRNPEELERARTSILAGLEQARSCRTAALAELDDDREWLPNPRQKNHAMPLKVDEALYDTWAGVLDDIEGLMTSRAGLSIAQVAQLGRHRWHTPPAGSLDVGRLFTHPADIVIPLDELSRSHWENDPRVAEGLLARMFGAAFRPSMPDTPLFQRLERMWNEVDRGEDTFERKLRYLLWLN